MSDNDKNVRVAIIGVGNCASSLVQGVHFYREAKEDENIPGIMHVNLGGYHIRDIEFTAAFDVVDTKVGKDIAGPLIGPSSYFMKTPPKQFKDDVAREMTEAYICGAE